MNLLRKIALNLLLVLLAVAVCALVSWLVRPGLIALVDQREWLTTRLLMTTDLLIQGLVVVYLLGRLGFGPRPSTLFAPRLPVAIGVSAAATSLLVAICYLVDPRSYRSGFFAPISPFTSNSFFWLGTVLPLVVSAFQEEVFHRGLSQTLLSRLTFSKWVGLGLSAFLFTAGHPRQDLALVAPGALLLGVVFLRTQSLVCTTLLHIALNVTLDVLHSTRFTAVVFLSGDDYDRRRLPYGIGLLILAILFELVWRRCHVERAEVVGAGPGTGAHSSSSVPST